MEERNKWYLTQVKRDDVSLVEAVLKISDSARYPEFNIDKFAKDELERDALRIALKNESEEMCRVLISYQAS